MARRKITRDFYDALVVAFREHPGEAVAAAKKAGVTYRTAKRGWEQGWPSAGDFARPIQEVIGEEQAEARAQRQKTFDQEESTRSAIRRDAIDTRSQEGVVVRIARNNAVGYLGASQQMLVGVTSLAKRLRAELESLSEPIGTEVGDDGVERPVFPDLDMGKALRLMQTTASALRQGNEAALIAMRMERLHMGEPEMHLGVQVETMEQAEQHVARATRALERARRKGLSLVSNGGSHGGHARAGNGAA